MEPDGDLGVHGNTVPLGRLSVSGFTQKVESIQGGSHDDTALNGIAMLYIQNGDPSQVFRASSKEGTMSNLNAQTARSFPRTMGLIEGCGEHVRVLFVRLVSAASRLGLALAQLKMTHLLMM